VEVCPECGSYVDVPRATERSPIAEPKVELPNSLDPFARTNAQLWFEVSAVLCLAYLPWMLNALTAISVGGPRHYPFVIDTLGMIGGAARVAMPLLVILALTRDRWSLFGIVRPKWITDVLLGLVICSCGAVFRRFVISLLPLSVLKMPRPTDVENLATPEGMPECLLLLIGFIAMNFAEELVFRGYLIPRFERLMHSTWIAVLATTALFASYHVYYGVVGAIDAAAVGCVYAIAFCLLRRLWPLCLAHALYNILPSLHLTR
jgi:membrane protease YdiL (CAAX protease family)